MNKKTRTLKNKLEATEREKILIDENMFLRDRLAVLEHNCSYLQKAYNEICNIYIKDNFIRQFPGSF